MMLATQDDHSCATVAEVTGGVRDDRDSTFPQTQNDASEFEPLYGSEWEDDYQDGTEGV